MTTKSVLVFLAIAAIVIGLFGMRVTDAMEAQWTNATQLTDGRPLPTDEGPLSTDIFWKLKSAPDTAWQLWGSLDQSPPFPATGTLFKAGYPAPEKSVIHAKARHRLGSRNPSDFSAPTADLVVPVDPAVGCNLPSTVTIK